MLAGFQRTKQTGHAGGRGAAREELVRAFLRKHLPSRFGVGTGQLVHPANLPDELELQLRHRPARRHAADVLPRRVAGDVPRVPAAVARARGVIDGGHR
jgi:hypothetical protein